MPTIISINIAFPQKELLTTMATHLRNGGIIIHPTDTCYGLAGRWDLPEVHQHINHIKGGRGEEKKFSMACAHLSMAHQWLHITPSQEHFLKKHMPERLSCILPGKHLHPTIVLRIPKLQWWRRVIQSVGFPLITTSANITTHPPMYDGAEVVHTFGTHPNLTAIYDGGVLPLHPPSTLIDLRTQPFAVLRQGGYTLPTSLHEPMRMDMLTRKRYPQSQLIPLSIHQGTLHLGPSAGVHHYLHPTSIPLLVKVKQDPLLRILGLPCTPEILHALQSYSLTYTA